MKKVIRIAAKMLFLASVINKFVACGGRNGSSSSQNEGGYKSMQYKVSVDDDFLFQMNPNTAESGACFKVFECAENGDKIHENKFDLTAGSSKVFTAQKNVSKVKVYVSFCEPLGHIGEMTGGWLPLVYYLSSEEIKEISIDTHVEMSRIEP